MAGKLTALGLSGFVLISKVDVFIDGTIAGSSLRKVKTITQFTIIHYEHPHQMTEIRFVRVSVIFYVWSNRT